MLCRGILEKTVNHTISTLYLGQLDVGNNRDYIHFQWYIVRGGHHKVENFLDKFLLTSNIELIIAYDIVFSLTDKYNNLLSYISFLFLTIRDALYVTIILKIKIPERPAMVNFPSIHIKSVSTARKSFIIANHGNERTKQEDQLVRNIQSLLTNLPNKVKRMIEDLSFELDYSIPKVPFTCSKLRRPDGELLDIIKNENSQGLRVLINIKPAMDGLSVGTVLSENDISHLVGIELNISDIGWKKSGNLLNTTVRTEPKNIESLLQDITLDISMYHGWLDNYCVGELDYSQRKNFSKDKVIFALNNGYNDTCYGPLNEDSEYVSFASLSREGVNKEISYYKYKGIWESFLEYYYEKNERLECVESASTDTILSNLKKYHKFYGSLKKSKIQKDLSMLPEGKNKSYYLLTTLRRPNAKKVRKGLGQIFNRSDWHPHLSKIIEEEELYMYTHWAPYLLLFKFRK